MRGSKPRVWIAGQAQGLHAPPAIAGRRIASRPQPFSAACGPFQPRRIRASGTGIA